MLPSIFGARNKLVEKLLVSSWSTSEERDQLCVELRKSARPGDVTALLGHSDLAVRGAAGDVLVSGADERSAVLLLETAEGKPPHVRSGLFRLFGRFPEGVQKQACEGLIRERNPVRQRLGWEAVLNLSGAHRFTLLERAATEGPSMVRQSAVQKLLAERAPAEQIDLILKLARDTEPRIAQAAMDALARIDDPRVLPVMLDRFQHADAVSRQAAATWLEGMAKRAPVPVRNAMLEALGAGDDGVRRHAIGVILATGEPVDMTLAILQHARTLVGWLRQRILESLKSYGDRVLAPAMSLLNHADEEVRTSALVVAEHFRDPRVIEPVARLLADPDWWIRISACDTLGRLGDARAVPHLVKALEDPECRWAAIDGLAQIGSPEALRPLVQLLRDPRQEVRLEVLRALARFDDPRLAAVLDQVREKDPSADVRTRAGEVARDLAARLGNEATGIEKGTMAVSAASVSRPLDRLLAMVREKGGSDVHITVGEPPMMRVDGRLTRMDSMAPLDESKAREAVYSILEPRQRKALDEIGEIDFCHAIPEVGRYRANAFVQRRGLCANFRVIPNVPPTFADLRIPAHLSELLDYHQGLIVVSGPAGSGKSTTLAAIVNLINETKADHVITLEDPIEFAHPVKNALVNQREVGRHTESFARALRAALREDPDVIVVGEMRDVETVRLALTAAETGHLVVGTLHTVGAVATIDRLIKSFPPDEQAQVRMALSESLKYVVSQQLIPRADGKGRVGVFEVLKGTLSVGNLVRDNKTFQLASMMQIGKRHGMQTRDVALMELVEAKLITPESAWARADKPETFESLCDATKIRPPVEAS